MRAVINRLDHLGQGIALCNGVVTFVPKTVPNDIVEIEITKVHKNYQEAKVIKVLEKSATRVDAFCPYYSQCGGCSLQNLSYEDTLNYKVLKVKDILKKAHIEPKIEVIKNSHPLNYRNKIELQIKDGNLGFYKTKSQDLIKIDNCPLAMDAINKIIPDLQKIPLKSGKATIRANQQDELLIIFDTDILPDLPLHKWQSKHQIKGIVWQNKCIFGKPYLNEEINNLVFKYQYDAFFQVNPYVAYQMFLLVENLVENSDTVLDLYCGVGTLSLNAAKRARDVFGIEVVANAILNALDNAKKNHLKAQFLTSPVKDALPKIKEKFNTIIIDPPRKGIDPKTLEIIINNKPNKIIYISCDPQTMARDLKELIKFYEIKKFYILDMFSYTYHVESLCVLNLK